MLCGRDGQVHQVPIAPKAAMSSPLMSTMEKTRAVQVGCYYQIDCYTDCYSDSEP